MNGFKRKAKAFFIARAVLFILGLGFFYYKYVPMVKPFQIIFLPILLATAYLGWKNVQTGTLFFIFVFPLINNLPYLFGIYEPIPHAPAALVLFLFLALGILLRQEPYQLINGTFKDALSFGSYLSMAVPLFIGA